jgi:hypothetical protein
MTNKEILDEVYRMVANGYVADIQDDVKGFIEQEWQKADEQALVDQYNRNREAKDHAIDVTEIERHRGLVIGKDGTVKSLE